VPVLVAFVLWELRRVARGVAPLVDVRLFRNRSFAAGVGVAAFFFAGFTSVMFVLSIYYQTGLSHSALIAGLILLPFAAGSFIAASNSYRMTTRFGRGVMQMGTGTVVVGLGALALIIHATAPTPPALAMIGPLFVAGLGCGLVIAPTTGVVLSGVPGPMAGSAAGTLSSAQRLGTALGIALVGIVLFGELEANSVVPSATTSPTTAVAQDFSASVQPALWLAIGFVFVAGLLVGALPSGPLRRPGPPASQAASVAGDSVRATGDEVAADKVAVGEVAAGEVAVGESAVSDGVPAERGMPPA
jgi:hypothetical protein